MNPLPIYYIEFYHVGRFKSYWSKTIYQKFGLSAKQHVKFETAYDFVIEAARNNPGYKFRVVKRTVEFKDMFQIRIEVSS